LTAPTSEKQTVAVVALACQSTEMVVYVFVVLATAV